MASISAVLYERNITLVYMGMSFKLLQQTKIKEIQEKHEKDMMAIKTKNSGGEIKIRMAIVYTCVSGSRIT